MNKIENNAAANAFDVMNNTFVRGKGDPQNIETTAGVIDPMKLVVSSAKGVDANYFNIAEDSQNGTSEMNFGNYHATIVKYLKQMMQMLKPLLSLFNQPGKANGKREDSVPETTNIANTLSKNENPETQPVNQTRQSSSRQNMGDSISKGQNLKPGQFLESSNKKYRLYFQEDGNLVLRNQQMEPLWSSQTHGKGGTRLVLQGDNNLVIYTNAGEPVWASNTVSTGADKLELSNEGNLGLMAGDHPVWNSAGESDIPGITGDDIIGDVEKPGMGNDIIDATTLDKKIMAGYQGWFFTPKDGSDVGWKHWAKGKPNADNITIDMWPDMSEYGEDELEGTTFQYEDGSNAGLYSAYDADTVDRHVKWMKDYGIDGVWVQRFLTDIKHQNGLEGRDQVLQNIRNSSEKYGRVFANMYDISGYDESTMVSDIKRDWMHLVDDLKITESDRYIHHEGKPVLSLWGLGFGDRPGTPKQAQELIDWFTKEAPEKYRVTLMGGVDPKWQSQSNEWKQVYKNFDIISPWTVGRYADEKGADNWQHNKIEPDMAALKNTDTEYMPVVFPGFSWSNLKGDKINKIPRDGGEFYWEQLNNAVESGANMIYVAMFDEVDEGTAIYKLAENSSQTPTTGDFLTLDADGEKLPSDWFLTLTGLASKILKGELSLSDDIPIEPSMK